MHIPRTINASGYFASGIAQLTHANIIEQVANAVGADKDSITAQLLSIRMWGPSAAVHHLEARDNLFGIKFEDSGGQANRSKGGFAYPAVCQNYTMSSTDTFARIDLTKNFPDSRIDYIAKVRYWLSGGNVRSGPVPTILPAIMAAPSVVGDEGSEEPVGDVPMATVTTGNTCTCDHSA